MGLLNSRALAIRRHWWISLLPTPIGETDIIIIVVVIVPLNKRAKSRPIFWAPETATEVHNDIRESFIPSGRDRIFDPEPPQRYTTIFLNQFLIFSLDILLWVSLTPLR